LFPFSQIQQTLEVQHVLIANDTGNIKINDTQFPPMRRTLSNREEDLDANNSRTRQEMMKSIRQI
jgi:hypothetical protein